MSSVPPRIFGTCEFCGDPLEKGRDASSLSVCDACIPTATLKLIPQIVGVYLPLVWARSWRTCFDGVDLDAVATLLRGPGEAGMKEYGVGDAYWDAWEVVLASASCRLTGRRGWRLYDSNDGLHLVHAAWEPPPRIWVPVEVR